MRWLLGVLVLVAVSEAEPRPQDAEAWVSLRVAPALVRQLTEHPRFRGETIRIVIFVDDKPAARSDAFSLSLQNRLSAAVLDTPGIRLAALHDPNLPIDCTLDDIDYYVGLQVSRLANSEFRIDLRTLDLSDRTWVTGLELTWQGALTNRQQRAFETVAVDPYFEGRRTAPFDVTETDILARKLARELACASVRQMQGEYVVHVDDDVDGPLQGTTELVGNNLAALALVQFTDDPKLANAVLRGKAHEVDEGLNQYWATLAPIDTGSDLPILNASAYVNTPLPQRDRVEVARRAPSVLSPATLIEVSDAGNCRNRANRCVAMRVQSRADAVVFFLNHQKNHGLVRLSSGTCRVRPDARVLRADDALLLPLPVPVVMPDAATSTNDWRLVPEADTYYAVAVSDSEAAHVVSRHLQKLPQRCTAAVRFGLRDAELETWMDEFMSTVDAWRDHIDWQAVQVRNVF